MSDSERRYVILTGQCFCYEDELPEDFTDADYAEWFEKSWVDIVRVGPCYMRQPVKPGEKL